MTLRYSVFWGCTILTRLPNIEIATRRVLDSFGIEIREIEGLSCCPEPYTAALVGRKLRAIIGARNMALAESQGLELMTVCNGCFETFFEISKILRENEQLQSEINDILAQFGKRFRGILRTKHIVEVLHQDVGLDRIQDSVKRPFQRLRVGLHAGCHLRKAERLEDTEVKPRMFEDLVHVTGAQVVDYGLEKMCCGYPQRQADEELSLKETLATKLRKLSECGVDCVVLVCPGCDVQFEYGQIELRQRYGMDFRVPVIHLSELLALSLGIPSGELGLDVHRISTKPILEKFGE